MLSIFPWRRSTESHYRGCLQLLLLFWKVTCLNLSQYTVKTSFVWCQNWLEAIYHEETRIWTIFFPFSFWCQEARKKWKHFRMRQCRHPRSMLNVPFPCWMSIYTQRACLRTYTTGKVMPQVTQTYILFTPVKVMSQVTYTYAQRRCLRTINR